MPDLIDTDGRTVSVSDENVANALSQGWRAATTGDTIKRAEETAKHEAYGGVSGGAKALYYGALRGATLGLSDVGLRALGTSAADLQGYKEENPGLSTAAEFGTMLAPGLAGMAAKGAAKLGARGAASALGGVGEKGGLFALTPAGAVSGIGKSIVDAAEAGGAGVVGKAIAGTAGAAAEGALYGGGSYLSQTAIEDKPLAAEGFIGAMGKGALWAAPVGGALSLGESALIRARSLFPRAEMTKEAARGLDRDATSAISQSLTDGEQMARKARQQIALTEAKIGKSQATEQMTRSMFGAADDAALQNQVVGAAEHSELSGALKRYETSTAEFENWVRAEADPDLERALLQLRGPDVQVGAPKLRAPEFGEVVPPQAGRFDAAGTPGPHEPPRVPITSDLPPLPVPGSHDLTRVMSPSEVGPEFDPVTKSGFHGKAPEILPRAPSPDILEQADGLDPGAAKATAAPPATDTLTGQLRAMESRLGAGENLKEMGAPARAEYAAAKAEKTAAASEHFRAKAGDGVPTHDAIKAHEQKADDYLERTVSAREIADRGYYEPPGGHADAVRTSNARKAIEEGQRESVKLNVSPTGKITITDGRHRLAAAIEADKPIKVKWSTGFEPAADDVARGAARSEAKSLATVEPSATPRGLPEIPGAKRATLNSIDDFESFFGKDWAKEAPEEWMAEAKAMGGQTFGHGRDVAKTIVDGSMKDAMRGVVEEDAIAAALSKHNGKNVDIGSDLAKAAKVIGDRESAMADLADLLGADAPVMAAQNAKAYRAAMQEQAEKSGASAARAASDFDAKGGQHTLVDSDITKVLRAHESKSEAGAQRATVSMTKAETKEAAKEAGKPRGALSVAADVGTALEVLHALGVHTPDLSTIPVIGPVLSLYLKARAVLGVMGRKGGSIGRSTESVVASKSAAVRDRVAKATASMLEIGAKAARKAQPIAGPAGALAYKLFPGDGDTKSKDPRVLYDARMDELARAQQPGAIDQAVSDRVRTSDPELQSALTAQAQRAVDFLASKAPQKPMLLPMLPGDGVWHPSKTGLETWSRYVAAVHDPAGVLEDLANGHVTSEGAETLRVVYPQLFAEAQRRLLEHASEYTRTLPYARRVSLSIMFRVPVDGTMSAAHIQYLQASGPGAAAGPAPQPAQGAPAITGPLQIGQQTLTSLERRAGA